MKKRALEAVIGVLGVLAGRRGGGVVGVDNVSPVGSDKVAILVAVEALAGSKFSGGSLRGCSVRLPFCAPDALSSP